MTITLGATSQSVTVQVVDDDGMAVTGLVASTFPATSYKKSGNTAAVSITLVDLALITTSWASGGLREISGGFYRLDLPDAAVSTKGSVTLIGDTTGKHLLAPRIDVLDQIPNAAALFSGITSLANWLRAGLRSSAPDATALSEINSGGGTYDATTDSAEAVSEAVAAGGGGLTPDESASLDNIIKLLQAK